MSNYPTEPDNFPKKGSSGNGGIVAYSVEARYAYPSPRQIGGMLLDSRWQQVHFTDVPHPFGVPKGRPYNSRWLESTGLLGYQAAQALRWWFLAAAEAETSCLCIETRLVEHKIEYSYNETAIKAVSPIGGDDRSNIMPDWGKPVVSPQATEHE